MKFDCVSAYPANSCSFVPRVSLLLILLSSYPRIRVSAYPANSCSFVPRVSLLFILLSSYPRIRVSAYPRIQPILVASSYPRIRVSAYPANLGVIFDVAGYSAVKPAGLRENYLYPDNGQDYRYFLSQILGIFEASPAQIQR